MREIKFRAWDKDEKVMKDDSDATWALHNKMYEPYEPSRILMQYTGLHDKNGKEIYESDILEEAFGAEVSRGVVEYIDHGFWTKYKDGTLHLWAEEYREVIGNIYENPELLENKGKNMEKKIANLKLARREVVNTIEEALQTELINQKERDIMYFRYADWNSLENCGKKFGLTRERIRQIEAKVMEKFRCANVTPDNN